MVINAGFLFHAIRLYLYDNRQYAIGTFWYSIYYLGILFVLLLVDHYLILIHSGNHL
jgi:protoheme IX farnesyltransferase